jgi:glycosyltransferase involved in cell wall biosynthesis
MHVVFLTAHYLPQIGGIQVLLDRLGRELTETWGFSVSAVTRPWEGRPLAENINGTQVWRTPRVGRPNPARMAMELLRFLRQNPADALICVEPRLRLAFPAMVVTRLTRTPMLLLLTGTYSEKSYGLSRWIAGVSAKKIIGISEYALCSYRYWSSRSQVIYIGVDIDLASAPVPFSRRRSMVLTVARVNPRKHLELVIRVAKLLSNYEFVIVGDTTARPEYYASLMKLKDDSGANNVVFTGEIAEDVKNQYYRQARVFFLPTLHEMFGIVFAEAMAHGLPIVATNTAAVPELVTPLVGRLLNIGSAPQAFADAIENVILDEANWTMLSMNCRERSALYNWDEIVRSYASVLAQVTNVELTNAN